MIKILEDVLQLVETWPESAQLQVAERAREIDAELGSKTYRTTPQAPACMSVVYNDDALAEL